MSGKDSFEDRLRRREETLKLDAIVSATARADSADAVNYCYANASAEAGRLFDLIGLCVNRANAAIGASTIQFQFQRNATDKVRRGMAAAEVMYHQPVTNAGPQTPCIVVYGGSPLGSMGALLPAALQSPVPPDRTREQRPVAVNTIGGAFSIRWRGSGSSNKTSEEVAETIVDQVAEYFDRIERTRKQI